PPSASSDGHCRAPLTPGPDGGGDAVSHAGIRHHTTEIVRPLLAVHRRTMAMIGVAELFTLRIFFHRDRLVRFAVGAKLDVRQAFAMTVAWVCGRGPVIDRMLAELTGRKFGWFL